MKTTNRIRPNIGKKAASAQPRKTTESAAGKPVAGNTDIIHSAVEIILSKNQTGNGITIETILGWLLHYGLKNATRRQVRTALYELEAAGASICVSDELWKLAPESALKMAKETAESAAGERVEQTPDVQRMKIRALLDLSPSSKMETATKSVKAVLHLVRCKLLADFDGADNSCHPDYNELETQQLCGIMDLIDDADASLNDAYATEAVFSKEIKRLAGLPV